MAAATHVPVTTCLPEAQVNRYEACHVCLLKAYQNSQAAASGCLPNHIVCCIPQTCCGIFSAWLPH
jgi:hypothetical protein